VPTDSNKQPFAVSRTAVATAPPGRVPAAAPGASRFADGLAFLREFLSRPLAVASVVPSSVFLEQRVVRAAAAADARVVVELGPGTGGTTRALLQALPAQARLLAIESNPHFCARLRRRIADPRLVVQEGSAVDLKAHLARWGVLTADAVISGIPFSTLPIDAAQGVAASIEASLAPGGRFVAYQLRAHVAACAAPHLGAPQVEWEWRNLPPMRVFRWVKPAT